ncbi:MAG: DNA polymerase II large subunit [Candidatus Heimdallarchaeota archaeon]|nr:DNA polymerase II large subunit [Candidatus Heimdallarchaeota archaeon]MBY8994608.1 DNA polymerase II large subunit [Candidatus Heimdallarchaeota archaeon]
MEIIASDEMKAYFQRLEDEVIVLYNVAEQAREKGLDPELGPEIHLAKDVAGKVEGLMEIKGIADRIRSLGLQMDRENVAFKIAQEIAEGKLIGNASEEQKADSAIRAALAILTEGVTAAPLEGIAKVKIKRNDDNTRYLAIYFAGPIRAAGGTEAALTVLISDHVRKTLGLSRYKATRQEMKRFVEEIDLYNRVMHLQSPTTADQIEKAVKNLPVEVTGESTNPEEVSAFRDIPRIETNSLRGGACLVLNDGIIGRAMKILRTVNAVGLTDWDWLNDLKATVAKAQDDQEKEEQKAKTQPSYGYIKDVISGRPIFSHPSQPGGFRIRYGHSRNTGLAGIGIHPATMKVVMEFLAPGTHIRTERPGKGSVVMPVDTIDGPIVLLKDGTVLRLETYEQAEHYFKKIKEILFLGDLLVGFGEFLENNHPLIPSGFVEEWWVLYLESRIKIRCDNDLDITAKTVGLTIERLREFLNHPITTKPTQEEALNFCFELLLPLHPYYTYAWHDISFDEFFELRDQILKNKITDKQKISQISDNPAAIILKREFSAKRFLEQIGLPHRVKDGCVVIEENNLIIEHCMQLENNDIDPTKIERTAGPPFEYIVPFEIKMKNPIYSGARMGRPEKAKERKMNPPVHTLYPLEMEGGGNNRLILEAGKKKEIEVTVIQRECKTCSIITHLASCPNCHRGTEVIRSCPICGYETKDTFCKECKRPTVTYTTRMVNIEEEITRVKRVLGGSIPPKTKGVKKLMNRTRVPEILEKGFLRARHGLNVYKDGTIRFDSTDIPLMHFKPREVNATLEQLSKLGYNEDVNGEPLTDEEQICELKIQDVVLNIDNGEFLVRVSKYVDDLLESVYGLPRFYNITRITDMIGHLIIGLAPHTSSGITGRVIGFTSVKGNLAHPYWHAAKRRNCDGDEDAVILMLEGFLDFSKQFLPITRGGSMDAPLTLGLLLNPLEVDDESHAVDCTRRYPLEFYEQSFKFIESKKIAQIIDLIGNRLDTPEQFENFYYTHETSDIGKGPISTAYSRLGKMSEKLEAQLAVAKLIRAVNLEDVAERVINKHFFPDMIGCLRAFGTQTFRCVRCNTKYRRLPLTGKCTSCEDGGKLLLTVHKKTVTKYFETAKGLIKTYNLSEYLKQRLELFNNSIDEYFIKEVENQSSLTDFFGESN